MQKDYSKLILKMQNGEKPFEISSISKLSDTSPCKKEFFTECLNKLKDQSNKYLEDFISENIDEYLSICGVQLFQIPIQSLINIFSCKKFNFANHNLCYQLIKSYYQETNDNNIFLLLEYLDSNQLSSENLNDAINSKENHLGFMPKINFSLILHTKEEIDQLKESNRYLIEQVANFSKILKEHESTYKVIIEQKEENERLKQENDNFVKKVTKDLENLHFKYKNQKQMNQLVLSKLDNFKFKLKNMTNELTKIKNDQETIKTETNESFKKQIDDVSIEFNQEINKLKTNQDVLNKSNTQILKKIENLIKEHKGEIVKSTEKFDQLQNKIKENEDKIIIHEDNHMNLKKFIEILSNSIENSQSTLLSKKNIIPTGNWKQKSPTEFQLDDENNTYKVKSSSTWIKDGKERIDHAPHNLFDNELEKNVNGKLNVWASIDNPKKEFIQIEFKNPVTANVLSMTSRDSCYKQAPTLFSIEGEDSKILMKVDNIDWDKNMTKNFIFPNAKQNSKYKIVFYDSKEKINYGLAKLNLGTIE